MPAPARVRPRDSGTRALAVTVRLVVDPTACDGHGICAELFPEGIRLDDWGYPIVDGEVPDGFETYARQAVSACPKLALRIREPKRSKQGAGLLRRT
jgi:ferredoxin